MLMMLAVPVNAQDDVKGLIVSFNGPVREAYIGKFVRGLKDMAGLKGYELSIFENQLTRLSKTNKYNNI